MRWQVAFRRYTDDSAAWRPRRLVAVLIRRHEQAGCFSPLPLLLTLMLVSAVPMRRRFCSLGTLETLAVVPRRRHELAGCFPLLRRQFSSLESLETCALVAVLRRRHEPAGCLPQLPALLAVNWR